MLEEELSSSSTRLVHFATITSRVEAFVFTSALEHEGIRVWIGGEHHAGIEPISHALGGYRLEIFEADLQRANALAFELDWPDMDIVYKGQKRAVQRVLALFYGLLVFLGVPAMISGAMPVFMFVLAALNIPTAVAVDPRGRNDFHLVQMR